MVDPIFKNDNLTKSYREMEDEIRLLVKKKNDVFFELKKLTKQEKKFKYKKMIFYYFLFKGKMRIILKI
jgi:hypothetical protein